MQQKGFDVRNKVNSNETSTPTLHSALYNTQHNTIQEHFFFYLYKLKEMKAINMMISSYSLKYTYKWKYNIIHNHEVC